MKIPQKYFDAVAHELARGGPLPGLWARALAEAGGTDAARARYIQLRAEALFTEETLGQKAESTAQLRERRTRLRAKLSPAFIIFWLGISFWWVPIDRDAAIASLVVQSGGIERVRREFPEKTAQKNDYEIVSEILNVRPDLGVTGAPLASAREQIDIIDRGWAWGHQAGLFNLSADFSRRIVFFMLSGVVLLFVDAVICHFAALYKNEK